ncbi:hypothetical protein GCK72_006717 [Caenorhabditis remanei]|uniref:F-box associated domain-containing protein n=1 Tax=Caenorhabditis remanei TaxID=31234 RepID=A0A6A5HHD7_CAERE|nr:hypothetical protein GCK72_006717 [Caenorhabditis remanei]KAF1766759.1 hypothetical protein GCK72_006717 [Caenorhabditis remanei]
MYPNQNSVLIGPEIIGGLKDDSEILKLKRVHIYNIGQQLGMKFLSMFTGQHILLTLHIVSNAEITKIIMKWISNESMQSLHTLGFFIPDSLITPDEVVESLKTERFNSAIRPRIYHLDTKIYQDKPRKIDLSGDNCYDIIREVDGKRATLHFDDKYFKILVWN